jgi:hypothetical protein
MLTAMGHITPEITRELQDYLSPSAGREYVDVPINLATVSKAPAAGWGRILIYMALGGTSQNQSRCRCPGAGSRLGPGWLRHGGQHRELDTPPPDRAG